MTEELDDFGFADRESDSILAEADERATRVGVVLQLGEKTGNETARHSGLALQGAADNVREPFEVDALREVADGATAHRVHELIFVGAVSEHDDRDRRRTRDDLRDRPEPVGAGFEAEQADLGAFAHSRVDRRVGVLGLAAAGVALERQAEPGAGRSALGSDEDTGWRLDGSCAHSSPSGNNTSDRARITSCGC